MSTTGFTVFDTSIGACGAAWGDAGLCGLALPEADCARMLDRLERRHSTGRRADPPAAIAEAIRRVVALVEGGRGDDLASIELDLRAVSPFERRVYALARTIGPGATTTYGELSERLGDRRLARAVGGALGRNPIPIVVPCHRIIASGGRLGGFSAQGGAATKLRLLQIEQARTSPQPELFHHLSAAPRG